MRTLLALTLAAGLATSPAAVLAQANTNTDNQSTTTTAPSDTTSPANPAAGGNDTNAQAGGGMTADTNTATSSDAAAQAGTHSMEEALGAIRDETVTAEMISGLTDVSKVEVVKTSELQGGVSAATLDDLHTAAEQNKERLDALRKAISGNTALSGALPSGTDNSKILGAMQSEDGGLVIFVDDGEPGSGSTATTSTDNSTATQGAAGNDQTGKNNTFRHAGDSMVVEEGAATGTTEAGTTPDNTTAPANTTSK